MTNLAFGYVDYDEVDERYQQFKDDAAIQEAMDQVLLSELWNRYKSRLFTLMADALPADQLFARSFLRALAQLVYKRECRNHLERIQARATSRRQYDDHPF